MLEIPVGQTDEFGSFSVSLDDLVEVTWLDHYRYKKRHVGRMMVKTWGKVDGMSEDGIALILNEVQGNHALIEPRSGRPLYNRVMDGQFILWSTVQSINVLHRI